MFILVSYLFLLYGMQKCALAVYCVNDTLTTQKPDNLKFIYVRSELNLKLVGLIFVQAWSKHNANVFLTWSKVGFFPVHT